MKLANKLRFAFIITSLMTAITALVGYLGMSNLKDDFSVVSDLESVVAHVQRLRQADQDFVISNDQQFVTTVEDLGQETVKDIDRLSDRTETEQAENRLDRIRAQLDLYIRQFQAYANQRKKLDSLETSLRDTAGALGKSLMSIRYKLNSGSNVLDADTAVARAESKARQSSFNTANQMISRMLEARVAEKNFIIYENRDALATARALAGEVAMLATSLQRRLDSSQGRSNAEDAGTLAQAYIAGLDKYVTGWEAAGQALDQMTASAKEMQTLANEEAGVVRANIDSNLQQTRSFLLIAATVALVIAVLVGYVISRYITRAIDALLQSMRQVADGDLRASLHARSGDELGQLFAAANQMVERLKTLLGTIRETGNELKGASETINQINEENATAIDQQRGEISYIATAINEMSNSIQDVSGSAADTDTATQQANDLAVQGQEANHAVSRAVTSLESNMQSIVSAIESLKGESEQIGHVLDVIRTIAEQTNLLALNAAIEAARAGEHGRGFAVVADEVRTLAKRTQGSTDEIEQMISTLRKSTSGAVGVIHESEEGLKTVVTVKEGAENTINEIKTSLTQIADMMTQIASAAEQQGNVSEDINSNITSIDDAAQQTSQRAARASESSQSLVGIARRLDEQISQFTLDDGAKTGSPELD